MTKREYDLAQLEALYSGFAEILADKPEVYEHLTIGPPDDDENDDEED